MSVRQTNRRQTNRRAGDRRSEGSREIEARANEYQRTTLAELKEQLEAADHELVISCEIMTGRNTYPLVDDSASPFDLYICIEIERLRGAIRHLTANVHNELTTLEISAE